MARRRWWRSPASTSRFDREKVLFLVRRFDRGGTMPGGFLLPGGQIGTAASVIPARLVGPIMVHGACTGQLARLTLPTDCISSGSRIAPSRRRPRSARKGRVGSPVPVFLMGCLSSNHGARRSRRGSRSRAGKKKRSGGWQGPEERKQDAATSDEVFSASAPERFPNNFPLDLSRRRVT